MGTEKQNEFLLKQNVDLLKNGDGKNNGQLAKARVFVVLGPKYFEKKT